MFLKINTATNISEINTINSNFGIKLKYSFKFSKVILSIIMSGLEINATYAN